MESGEGRDSARMSKPATIAAARAERPTNGARPANMIRPNRILIRSLSYVHDTNRCSKSARLVKYPAHERVYAPARNSHAGEALVSVHQGPGRMGGFDWR